MRLALVGLSHKTASIEIRERACLAPDTAAQRLAALIASRDLSEALLLSTCNRSELYLVTDDCIPLSPAAVFAQLHDCPLHVLEGHLYTLEDLEAVAHLFKVAAGVDSMVFGETEIMGQIKQAIECAREAGTALRVLPRLGDRALAVGKRIRTETGVDRGCMSVASVAVELARQIFDDLAQARILLVGAGDTGALVTARMMDNGARSVVVASRTEGRAQELAVRFGARAIGFDEFPGELSRADIVISCTSAPHYLITVDSIRQALVGHGHRPLFLIDLAVPRDIDPAVRSLDDVYLYDIDDLEETAQACEQQRRCELPRVEALVEQEARDFMAWVRSLEIVPLMLAIRQQAEAIRQDEVTHLLQSLPDLTTRERKALHRATKRIVRRVLGQPLGNLRLMAHDGTGDGRLDVVRDLFGIRPCPPSGDDAARGEGEASD